MHFLGAIVGGSGAANNLATGASGTNTFTIPPGVKSLYLAPNTVGALFELFGATGATSTTAARGAPLSGTGLNGPYRTVPGPGVVVGIYNPIGGVVTVNIYSAPTT